MKKIDNPIQNVCGTLSQKTGLKYLTKKFRWFVSQPWRSRTEASISPSFTNSKREWGRATELVAQELVEWDLCAYVINAVLFVHIYLRSVQLKFRTNWKIKDQFERFCIELSEMQNRFLSCLLSQLKHLRRPAFTVTRFILLYKGMGVSWLVGLSINHRDKNI